MGITVIGFILNWLAKFRLSYFIQRPAYMIAAFALLLLIVLMLSGYFMIYVFSGYDSVSGYMAGSLDRLYLQIWPAFLFILATLPIASGSDDGSAFVKKHEP